MALRRHVVQELLLWHTCRVKDWRELLVVGCVLLWENTTNNSSSRSSAGNGRSAAVSQLGDRSNTTIA